MAVDKELLDILACPLCKGDLSLVPIPPEKAKPLVERYRPKFKGEEPVVTEGLVCGACAKLYPIVSDIPVMLVEDAVAP
jgi:uncharacterized protein YbaR (Trm112 family)